LQTPVTTDADLESRVADLLEGFGQNYATYQYAFVEFLVEHLTDLSRTFRGDFQQVMVLAIMGQRRLNELRRVGGSNETPAGGMAISASRLADVTGIPRETVRRKLSLLRDRGWVVQGLDGLWSLVDDGDELESPVRRDLAALDGRGRLRVARLVARLQAAAIPRRR
jgi:hypothetical protein